MTSARILKVAALCLLSACGDSPTAGEELDLDGRIDAAFAPPAGPELAAVREDWSRRNPQADNAEVVMSTALQFGDLTGEARIYAHDVDGNTHFGGVLIPDARSEERSLAVLVYGHPGDGGVTFNEIAFVRSLLGDLADEFVIVAPSFRSEPITLGSALYRSEGEPSPWDRDVDDALALLEVVLDEIPAADPDRIYAAGFSRGAGVALLMGVRDPRVRAVVEVAGPTDFTSAYVRSIVEEAVAGNLRSLPGLRDLDRQLIQPFIRGDISVDELRLELIRRSPAHFADRLPPVQIHHGEADSVVDVEQATILAARLDALGRNGDEVWLYPTAGHLPFGMAGIDSRIRSFLGSLLPTRGNSR